MAFELAGPPEPRAAPVAPKRALVRLLQRGDRECVRLGVGAALVLEDLRDADASIGRRGPRHHGAPIP
jgi:hypothetical protein